MINFFLFGNDGKASDVVLILCEFVMMLHESTFSLVPSYEGTNSSIVPSYEGTIELLVPSVGGY